MLPLALTVFLAATLPGPEVQLTPPTLDAATGTQFNTSMAWYGDSLVATWLDVREGPATGGRVAHLDALGHPKPDEPVSTSVGTPMAAMRPGELTPRMAIERSGYVTLGDEYGRTILGVSGRTYDGSLRDFHCDGTNCILVTNGFQSLTATLLDLQGTPLLKKQLGSSGQPYNSYPDVIAMQIGDAYHIVYSQIECAAVCRPAIHDAAILRNGQLVDRTLVGNLPDKSRIAAAANRDRLLVGWTEATSVELMLVSADGSLLQRSSIPADAPTRAYAATDGWEFLVAWARDEVLRASRVDMAGFAAGDPFTISSRGYPFEVSFAQTPLGVVMAFSSGSPTSIYTRGAARFDQFAGAPNVLASLGYAQQKDVSAYRDLTVWTEGKSSERLMSTSGQLAQSGDSIRGPRAAFAGDRTLVVWREVAPDLKTRVMGKLTGGAPFTIREANDFISASDAAFDGKDFIVTWGGRGLHLTRVTAIGDVRETRDLDVPSSVTWVRSVRQGDDVLIAWVEYPANSRNALIRTTRSSNVESAETIYTNKDIALGIDVALDDHQQPLIVWPQGSYQIFGARPAAGGGWTVRELVSYGAYGMEDPAVAWSGSEFVVAWTAPQSGPSNTVRIERVSANMNPIDKLPIDVSPFDVDTSKPSLVRSDAGVTLAYLRVVDEKPIDRVTRIFVRQIGRLDTPKRRAAR